MKKLVAIIGAIGLAFSAVAGTVTAAWNANVDGITASYKVYWGIATNAFTNYVATPNTQVTISNLTVGIPYYFAVSAVSSNLVEGYACAPVAYTIPFPTPATPTGLAIKSSTPN